jgi:hypothetical protein
MRFLYGPRSFGAGAISSILATTSPNDHSVLLTPAAIAGEIFSDLWVVSQFESGGSFSRFVWK